MKKILFFTKNLMSNIPGKDNITSTNDIHISEAMNWLLRAQEATPDKGVSEGFHMYHGWLPSYPETTGYIIETFFDYADLTGEVCYTEYAIKMVEWLCSIQNSDGSIPDSYFQKKLVFDTGQAIFGLVKAFKVTGDIKLKDAALKAGNWILSLQEKDGSWRKHAVHNIPHTYYSRVAWSLLVLHEICSHDHYLSACKRNIEWCLTQQLDNGWFNNASFNLQSHHQPFTHTIAYTLRGILENGISLHNSQYINATINAMDNIAKEIDLNGFLPGTFNKDWKGDKSFSCLTGSAQLAISFFKLAQLQNTEHYFKKGIQITNYLKSKQNISSNNLNIRGAIAGSYPIWGKYMHFTYPNWAIKFFIDALLLEEELTKRNEF